MRSLRLPHPTQGMPACVNEELVLSAGTTYPGLVKVEYLVEGEPAGTDTSPADGFRASWTPPRCGYYRLKAVGTFADHSTIESPEVTLTVYYGEGRYVWHSYNVNMKEKYITDALGNRAYLEFYESSDTDGVQPGASMNSMHDNMHPNEYTKTVIPYWTTAPGIEEPYVGRYTTQREAVPEVQKPVLLPYGVQDIALYPPWQKLTVIAFHVPADGDYMVTNLGVKKPRNRVLRSASSFLIRAVPFLKRSRPGPALWGAPYLVL